MKSREIPTETINESAPFSRYLTVLSPIDNQIPSRSVIHKRTVELVTLDMSQGELSNTISMMLVMSGVDAFLPPQYSKFKKVVMEGALFLLTHMQLDRIADKIVDQLLLPIEAESGERICTLVKDMPTLHKLSQIIGRSPGIDPKLKRTLVDLEDNISTVSYDDLYKPLTQELNQRGCNHLHITTEKRILAEASVCAVIPGRLAIREQEHGEPIHIQRDKRSKKGADSKKNDSPSAKQIVFKMVKPAIKSNMAAELALWGELGDHLDKNRDSWGLGDFQFKGTINQVSWLLQNEVDLKLEQQNLEAVSRYYCSTPSVSIPEKLSISTPGVTVMTRLEGSKITDVEALSDRQRRTLAKKVTRLCILNPIIDLEKETIFHGDPHAGNIAYRFESGKPRIIFYDWAMVGRLKMAERLAVILMISGLIAGNSTVIYYAADIMAGGKITSDPDLGYRVKEIINQIADSREGRISGVLSSVESLIEQLMYQGVLFSSDLLVFEKGLVTLKGVLFDIDPTFDRDEYIVWSAAVQLASDVAHFRLQSMVLKEIWSLYRYSLSLFLDIQRAILRFGWDMVKA